MRRTRSRVRPFPFVLLNNKVLLALFCVQKQKKFSKLDFDKKKNMMGINNYFWEKKKKKKKKRERKRKNKKKREESATPSHEFVILYNNSHHHHHHHHHIIIIIIIMRILLSCCANFNTVASTTSTTASSSTATTAQKVLRGGGGKALSRSKRSSKRRNSGGNFIVFASTKKKRIFIDGEAGTTGLQVRDRLEKRSGDIELIQLPDSLRKDAKAREEALNEADCAILCLPDAAAVEAVALVTNPNTVIIDASTAYRTNDEWTYGFPELSKEQREKVKTAKRISNPGCYPTGFIGLTKPLVENGFIPKGLRTTVNAVSGYTGGGKQLIAIYESPEAEPYGAYGFNLNHKHIPEMRKYAGLEHEPIFQPAVGSFAQGMLVSVPLFYDNMANVKSGKQLQECLKEWYKDSAFVSVREYNQTDDLERGAFLRADGLRDTNKLELSVFANDEKGTCLLVARLDNLGKGASGAAVQNLNLSLGLDETVGL